MRFPLFYVGTRPFSGDTEGISLPGHPSRSLPSATKIRLPRRPFRLCRLSGLTGQTKYTPSTAIRLDRKPDTQPLWPCFVLSNKHCFCFQHGIDFLFRPMEHSRPQRLYHLKIYANFPSKKGSPRMIQPPDLPLNEETSEGLAEQVKIVYFASLLDSVIHIQNGVRYTKR